MLSDSNEITTAAQFVLPETSRISYGVHVYLVDRAPTLSLKKIKKKQVLKDPILGNLTKLGRKHPPTDCSLKTAIYLDRLIWSKHCVITYQLSGRSFFANFDCHNMFDTS